jgi:hypothetical protein
MNTLSRGFRALFLIEIPICLGTAGYWLFGGEHYVRTTWALSADAGHHGLLRLQAGMLVSLLVWFYGRWLLAGVRELGVFRWFQEGLALGDVFLIAGAAYAGVRGEMSTAMSLAQAIPALIWFFVRVVFLVHTRSVV